MFLNNHDLCFLNLNPYCFQESLSNNNEKFRSFKSKEIIHKKEDGPYRSFGYLSLRSHYTSNIFSYCGTKKFLKEEPD